MRPNKDLIFLEMAEKLGTLGTCDRAFVGAIITKDGRCISWGFNGAPAGLPHCSQNGHGWLGYGYDRPEYSGAGQTLEELASRFGCRNATHAEANALAYAARQGISTDGGTLYVTMSPCATCARLLIAAGITEMQAKCAYRNLEGLELLQAAGILTTVWG